MAEGNEPEPEAENGLCYNAHQAVRSRATARRCACGPRQPGGRDKVGESHRTRFERRQDGHGLVDHANTDYVCLTSRTMYLRLRDASFGDTAYEDPPQKVWDRHVVHSDPDGDLLYVDLHLIHEVTSPQAFDGLRLEGRRVRRPDLTVATEDHNVPPSTSTCRSPIR